MMKDIFVSFYENIKTKSSNPFWGTLAIVWLVYNWNLVFTIFNFDSNLILEDKISLIIKHFKDKPFMENLWVCIFKTLVILIISYFLVNLSRLIINFYEKIVTPLVYKWTDKSSIVLKEVYIESENERKQMESKLEEERSLRLKYTTQIEGLESEIVEFKNQLVELRKPKEDVITEKAVKAKTSKPLNVDLEMNKKKIVIANMKKNNLIKTYWEIIGDILNGKTINKGEKGISDLLSYGIIDIERLDGENFRKYKITEFGKTVHDELLIENLK